MSAFSRARACWLCIVLGTLLPPACDTGGIVGGSCREGTEFCQGTCKDFSSDVNHCGTCGDACPSGTLCEAGECLAPGAGGQAGAGGAAGNAGDPGAGGISGSAGDAGDAGGAGAGSGGQSGSVNGGTGGRSGAGGTAGRAPTEEAGAAGALCLPPFDQPAQCGDCNTQCEPPNPLCAPDSSGGFECVPLCPPPLEACGDQCVDTQVHPLHCGACFNACPSGICQAGECVGANQGHVALYCTNYAYVQQQSAHTTLLGNAVFLPSRSEVRVLGFTRWADASVRGQVNRALGWAGAARGRAYLLDTIRNPDDLSAALSIQNYDVFLVYEQSQAAAGELAALGAAWATSGVVESFARAGGVVVVLDGAQGSGDMTDLMRAAGLFDVDGHSAIAVDDATTRLYNRAPGDALGINVVSPLSPVPYTCTFDTQARPSDDTVFVITDTVAPVLGSPVVVHRTYAPPP